MSKTKDVQISISGIDPETLAAIDSIAEREHRSRTGQIVKWLNEAVADELATADGIERKPARKPSEMKNQ